MTETGRTRTPEQQKRYICLKDKRDAASRIARLIRFGLIEPNGTNGNGE